LSYVEPVAERVDYKIKTEEIIADIFEEFPQEIKLNDE
jgi:hypothetical protein